MKLSADTIRDLPDESLPHISALRGDVARVAELVGVRVALILAMEFRGTYIYCRAHDHIARESRDQSIRDEYDRRTMDGESSTKVARDLALANNLVERSIWEILKKTQDKAIPQIQLKDNQPNLWG